MIVLQWIALLACGVAAFFSWSWYARSKNNGHLFIAICLSIATLSFAWLAILD